MADEPGSRTSSEEPPVLQLVAPGGASPWRDLPDAFRSARDWLLPIPTTDGEGQQTQWWTTQNDGTVWRHWLAGKGEARSALVSNRPVLIHERVVVTDREVGEGDVHGLLIGTFEWCGPRRKWFTIECRRSDTLGQSAMTALADKGLPVTHETWRELSRFLSRVLDDHERKIPRRVCAPRCGWVDHRCRTFVLPEGAIGEEGEIRLLEDGGVRVHQALNPQGDFDGWRDAVTPVVEDCAAVGVMLVASLASPLIRFLGVQGFAVDLAAPRGSGKTEALALAASAWGSPDEGASDFFASADSTMYAFERRANALGSLPVICNDTARVRRSGGRGPDETLDRTILALESGSGGIRGQSGGSRAGLRQTGQWATIGLFCGVTPVAEQVRQTSGAVQRVVTLLEDGSVFGEFTDQRRRQLAKLRLAIRRHYGWAGRRLVEHLVETDREALGERFEEHLQQWSDSGIHHPRFIRYLAILELAEALAREAGILETESVRTYFGQERARRVIEQMDDVGSRAAQYLRDVALAEAMKNPLPESEDDWASLPEDRISSRVWREADVNGVCGTEHDTYRCWVAPRSVVEDAIRKASNLGSPKGVLQAMREGGYLVIDARSDCPRLTVRVRFPRSVQTSGSGRAVVVAIRREDESD